ncbi:MAG: hypothetical protein IKJ83_01200 [Ruminococcus sp.]|nr:hypothetical protein [Ruminococcus sp.]
MCADKNELLNKIDGCETIADLFALVQEENIDMRMQTLCSASNIPPKMLTYDPTSTESPLERLRKVVRLTVENR